MGWWSSKDKGQFGVNLGHPTVTNGTLLNSCARATHSSQITLRTCFQFCFECAFSVFSLLFMASLVTFYHFKTSTYITLDGKLVYFLLRCNTSWKSMGLSGVVGKSRILLFIFAISADSSRTFDMFILVNVCRLTLLQVLNFNSW